MLLPFLTTLRRRRRRHVCFVPPGDAPAIASVSTNQGADFFVQMHLDGAGVKDCDHWHDDAGNLNLFCICRLVTAQLGHYYCNVSLQARGPNPMLTPGVYLVEVGTVGTCYIQYQ